jgi:hypothetical protein
MAGVRLEFAQFGHFDYFNIYRNSVSTAIENLGQPIGTSPTMYYEDLTTEPDSDYFYRAGVVSGAVEKFSEEFYVKTIIVNGLSQTLKNLFAVNQKGLAYNFQDISTLWQDTAGTIPITDADQLVARVDDLSGNNNHIIQTDVSKRPQLKQDAQGFYLWFDGTKSMYSASTVDFNDLLNFTALCRFTKEENSIGCILESSVSINSNTGTFSIFQESNNISLNNAGSGYNSAQVALDNDSLFVGAVKVLENPKINMMRVNGVDKTQTNILNQSSQALLNHNIYVGARGGTSLFLTSKVRALAFLGRELASSEIENIESLLMP